MRSRGILRLAAHSGVVALVAAAAAAPAPAAPTEPLSHEGRWITDAKGRVVILHGWNMVNKLAPYYPSARGFGRDDARFLAAHGFNTVRLGIIHKGLEPEPGVYDEAYLDRIERTAGLLADEGIFVLLDFHQDMYNERFNGEGEPDWSVIGDAAVLPAEPDQGFPGNYLVMPPLSRAYDNFLTNLAGPGGVGLQDRYAAAWVHVVERFRDDPRILGYNIFNEPWPGSEWPSCANPAGCPGPDALLTAFHAKVLDAIRAEDPNRLVFYAPFLLFDFGADTTHGDLGDPNTGFAFNMYCLAFAGQTANEGFPDLANQGCGPEYDIVLNNADAQSQQTGDALLLTEYAATTDLPTIRDVAEKADEHMISWQQWAYFNEDPCCVRPKEGLLRDLAKPPTGHNVRRAKLDAAERPYPQLIAGTPLNYGYDTGSGVFTLRFLTAPAGRSASTSGSDRSAVYIPPSDFRAYRAHASGAHVISRPGASILRLENLPGADQVELRVEPLCTVRLAGTESDDALEGTEGGDLIVGRGGADAIDGGDGGDCLYGRFGGDRIRGGAGPDLVYGGRGADRLSGGAGADEIRGKAGRDVIRAADGERDTVRCGTGRDVARVDRADRLQGCERIFTV